MRTVIIHNPRSGFGSDAIFEFARCLMDAGDECVIRALGDEQPVAQALDEARGFDLAVISGGDGTVASALYALADSDVPTCVFPSGTANLLFESLGNAPEPMAIARACREGVTVRLDIGEMRWRDQDGQDHRRGFSLMAGSGYDAQIMAEAAPNKGALGEAAYFTAVAAVSPQQYRFSVELDGETHESQGMMAMACNSARIQGDIELISDCRMDDGVIEVVVSQIRHRPELLPTVATWLMDPAATHVSRPMVERFSGTRLRVTADRPLPLQIDGEPIPGTTTGYEVRVLPGAARLIVDPLSPFYPEGR